MEDSRRSPARHPVAFLVATLTWTSALLAIAALLDRPWTAPPIAALFVAATIGPAGIASLFSYLDGGRTNLAALWRRALAFHRLAARWWIIIIGLAVAAPLVARLVTAGTSQGWYEVRLTAGFLLVGALAGLAEEPGWRGYGLDGLLGRHPPAVAALVVGVAWTIWHLPLFLIEGTYQSGLEVATPAYWTYLAVILVQSFVYTWLYLVTNRSVAAVVALHALANVAAEVFSLEGAETVELVVWTLIAVAVLGSRPMRSTGQPLQADRRSSRRG